jgi:hypothetical protein
MTDPIETAAKTDVTAEVKSLKSRMLAVLGNCAPSAAGVYEWICTTAGSPGTWKSISNT